MKGKGSKRRSSGASVFHPTQTTTTTVIHIRNRAVPMKRANCSAKIPNASVSYDGALSSGRRCSLGVSSRPLRRSARRSAMAHLRRGAGGGRLVAPVLRQQVVEQVVDGHGTEQSAGVVDDRCRDQVVGGQVRGDLVDRGLGVERVHALVEGRG